MASNKENEDKSRGTSKIPVLIRSLPKSGRPQTKKQQQRLVNAVAREPLTTLAFQRVNRDLAGPSHAQSRCSPEFAINEKYLLSSPKEKRHPLKSLTCENQNVVNLRAKDNYPVTNKIVPYFNCGQGDDVNCLTGPTSTYSISDRLTKQINRSDVENIGGESESKVPGQWNKNTTEGPFPITINSDLGIISTDSCLAGPSGLKRESLGNNSGIFKVDGMVAAFKKDIILASSLDKSNFFTPPLELGSLKKVKRTLKRPHSRGLQSLPYIDGDLKKDEQKISFDDSEKKTTKPAVTAGIDILTECYTTDALLYLLEVERKPLGSKIPDTCRSSVINYMMIINGSTGQSAVVQSAVWFIDSLYSPGFLDQLHLTAAACVWIASKLHVGAIHGMRMVKRSNYEFSIQDLAMAEKRVLHELKFPTYPVIPQDFIPYLCWWCDPEPGMIESAATFLCLCGLTVNKSIGIEYSSVVAVASVKTALELLKMEEQIRRLEECPVYHSAMKKADISVICSILRESLHKMAAVDYENKVALIHYSQKPFCIAPKLAYANHCSSIAM